MWRKCFLDVDFGVQVDRRHALYRGHEKLRELLDKEDARGVMLLGNLRALEEKCVEDMEEHLGNFDERVYAKVACIFQHMADIELNFYKWWGSPDPQSHSVEHKSLILFSECWWNQSLMCAR